MTLVEVSATQGTKDSLGITESQITEDDAKQLLTEINKATPRKAKAVLENGVLKIKDLIIG